MRRILTISGSLNFGLALWLFIAGRGKTESSPELNPVPTSLVRRAIQDRTTEVNQKETNAPVAEILAGFHWSQVESGDYRKYIDNLRAIGCPENLIGQMISADLAGTFMARSRQIWDPGPRTYWRNHPVAGVKERKALAELEQEHGALLKELLGRRHKPTEMIDLLFLQSGQREHHLAFLPAERRAAAEGALAAVRVEDDSSDPNRWIPENQEKELQQKLAALEGILSEDELREYELRASPLADRVRNDVKFMQPTPEEFEELMRVRAKVEKDGPSDHYARERQLAEAVKQVLGEERGRDYARSSDLFYQWSREAAARFGIPETAAEEAWQIKTETMVLAERIGGDEAASIEERQRKVAELRQSTEQRLKDLLGPEAFGFATRGDGVWLQMMVHKVQ